MLLARRQWFRACQRRIQVQELACTRRTSAWAITETQEAHSVVTTYKRLRIPTDSPSHRIPLSIVDIHLRNEQLPFCYFFEETLDEQALEDSLQKVLQAFAVTGGKICASHLAIQVHPDDAVQLTFGRINTTLKDWNSQQRGHVHQSTLHPILLPLFDSLFEHSSDNDDGHVDGDNNNTSSLMKIRVTYFQGHGTAIGVNFNHALGDTASCVQFVRSWGKQMRSKQYQASTACTNRSRGSISGMMTTDIADVMGLTTPTTIPQYSSTGSDIIDRNSDSYLPEFMQDWMKEVEATPELPLDASKQEQEEQPQSDSTHHEYVRLAFPPVLLEQLKVIGTFSCLQDDTDSAPNSFVSTNDMVTAFGWLMKRHLSQHSSHSVSMVVNLRGRSDVSSTLFGNGITHIVASLPATTYPPCPDGDDPLGVDTLCQAAKAIRLALHAGLSDISHSLSMSRMGRPEPPPANSTESFSTTSWGQFPLYKIRFGKDAPLVEFHGHPAHPLPVGKTFASVITPRPDGGFWYEMLVPSDRVAQARQMHEEMAALCMQWKRPEQSSSTST